MSERFHITSAPAPGLLTLSGPEAHHLVVSRLRPGERVALFSGDGSEHPAEVVSVGRRDVTVDVLGTESPARELPVAVEIAACVPKGDRAQFLVEKLTELGVSVLHLLITRRSVVLPREAKQEKLDRYVIEACKQCGRNTPMEIRAPRPWEELIADGSLPRRRLLAHVPREGETTGLAGDGGPAVAAVGPEGGFTEEEVEAGRAAGWKVVGLGRTVLRVETAAVALAVMLRG